MARLSTAAWVAHNVGLATCFGGQPFGKPALNPTLDALSPKTERGMMLNAAWNRYNVFNSVSLGTIIAVTTVLSQKAGQSARWSAVSRFLP